MFLNPANIPPPNARVPSGVNAEVTLSITFIVVLPKSTMPLTRLESKK